MINNVLNIEEFIAGFIRHIGGQVLDDTLPKVRTFENADFVFSAESIIIELKEIKTEFSNRSGFQNKMDGLFEKLIEEDPNWKPSLLGGNTSPQWFLMEQINLYRPPLSRILKKANRQIKATKSNLNLESYKGIVVVVNDGLAMLYPLNIASLISQILEHSYSSVSCFVYLNLNSTILMESSEEGKLIWAPVYRDPIDKELSDFVNLLGKKWFDYLEEKIGGFSSRIESENMRLLEGSIMIKE